MIAEMPIRAVLTMDDEDRRYARTPTQDAVNRRCLLAQTRHFGGYSDQLEPCIPELESPKPESVAESPRRFKAETVEELDADNLTEMLRMPIRSNFRVLAKISQVLRECPDFV